ncbi:ERCC4 domain-containing protein [Ceratocystis lukuohia]|uniref:ERCC4 domain-containing protein n=1 Tax=Ceratocystis lukuohia TaxID=2019550 RepID=A0ABR4MFH3_9PEZI
MSNIIDLVSSSPIQSKKRKSHSSNSGRLSPSPVKRHHFSPPAPHERSQSQVTIPGKATPASARALRSGGLRDLDDIFDFSSPIPADVIDLRKPAVPPKQTSQLPPKAISGFPLKRTASAVGEINTADQDVAGDLPEKSVLIDDWNDDSIFRLEEELGIGSENPRLSSLGAQTPTVATTDSTHGTSFPRPLGTIMPTAPLATVEAAPTAVDNLAVPLPKTYESVHSSKRRAPSVSLREFRNVRDFDPITLSSSPEPSRQPLGKENYTVAARPSQRSSRAMADLIMSSSQPEPHAPPLPRRLDTGLKPSLSAPIIDLGSDSDNDFPDLDAIRARPSKDSALGVDGMLSSPLKAKSLPRTIRPPLANPGKISRTKLSRTVSAMGTLESNASAHSITQSITRAEAKVAKEAEKARLVAERAEAKEQKKRDKARAAALAEANKLRTDKKISTPEMVVLLPVDLPETTALQAKELLNNLKVQTSQWTSPVPRVVRWRRNVTSRYNKSLESWEPIEPQTEDEKYAMVIMDAQTFVDRILGGQSNNMEAHVKEMRRCFPGYTLMYMLVGLRIWQHKNKTSRNRQFRQGAVGTKGSYTGIAETTRSRGSKRQAASPMTYIDEDRIEDALLELQVMYGHVLIHHVYSDLESAQWIATFTQHISTVPYRKVRDATNAAAAMFCMQTGQVRTGEDAQDTYVRMLQEIVRVTAPSAYGVAAKFSSVQSLLHRLESGGPLALQAVAKVKNKEGDETDDTVGQAISRRIHKVFTGCDEESVDI